ncbi:MAG: UDP-N-acetylmuramate:L-alanyl-gamma-D-glutamyl-meso-diaminopimelate ligase [Acidobacteria bacterium]|nr:MAG: UDP-N-acetylmuramate:L-alanyl-gamma-D-glutamyl-meso-diaminopimelate ligase [Acidobacteriota bacterium]
MVSSVHLVGICGTGMGSLAALFKAAGWLVRGSDRDVYPPMSDQLARLGIEIDQGYSPGHLDWAPDLVVVGNIARPDNPEALEAEHRGLPVTSMASALADHFLAGRTSVVAAGTHGKTTTAALLAWALHAAGRDPGFLVGGVLSNFAATSRLGDGPEFVVEGDEYHNAFFDRQPKFMHYRPEIAILTSVELDHIELFPDVGSLRDMFRSFIRLVPAHGRLLACHDDAGVRATVPEDLQATVTWYGLGDGPGTRSTLLEAGPGGMTFAVHRQGRSFGTFRSPLVGAHNLLNLTAVVEVLIGLGVNAATLADGLAGFKGIKRRQEIRGCVGGVTVVDDFAHHPTAVRETLRGLRLRHTGARLVAVFEPRTHSSRRAVFQEDYTVALTEADRVIIAAVHDAGDIPAWDRLDPTRMAADLCRQGTDAAQIDKVPDIVHHLATTCRRGDVIAVLSNGPFGGIHQLLLAALSRLQSTDGQPAPEMTTS